MAKPRSQCTDYLVYVVYPPGRLFRAGTSRRQAPAISRWPGLASLSRSTAAIAKWPATTSVRLTPTNSTIAEVDALVRAVYRHFCTLALEIVLLPRLLRTDELAALPPPGGGRPHGPYVCSPVGRVFIVTCHWGNWELAGYALGLPASPRTPSPGRWTTPIWSVFC